MAVRRAFAELDERAIVKGDEEQVEGNQRFLGDAVGMAGRGDVVFFLVGARHLIDLIG